MELAKSDRRLGIGQAQAPIVSEAMSSGPVASQHHHHWSRYDHEHGPPCLPGACRRNGSVPDRAVGKLLGFYVEQRELPGFSKRIKKELTVFTGFGEVSRLGNNDSPTSHREEVENNHHSHGPLSSPYDDSPKGVVVQCLQR